jgi:hypothetical protein
VGGAKIPTDTHIPRWFLCLPTTKIRGRVTQTDRQQRDIISLLSFLKIKKVG